jgi:hypothetical protein
LLDPANGEVANIIRRVSRPRAQIAERANCPLMRPFRAVDRFHQHVMV